MPKRDKINKTAILLIAACLFMSGCEGQEQKGSNEPPAQVTAEGPVSAQIEQAARQASQALKEASVEAEKASSAVNKELPSIMESIQKLVDTAQKEVKTIQQELDKLPKAQDDKK